MSTRLHRIAAIPGVGKEVISAGLRVLDACASRDGAFELTIEDFDWGSDYYKERGVTMPADGNDRLRAFDAIFFGGR